MGKEITVISVDNYRTEHQEPTPFKADLVESCGRIHLVKSKTTKKMYELYDFHIKEFSDEED